MEKRCATTGTIIKFPPSIRHVGGRPSEEAQGLIVGRALANLRIPKAARKLMQYYASKSNGFRPSLKTIDEATTVGEKNVSTIRQYLVRKGLVGYDGRHVIIDWVRLSALASMEPGKMGEKKHWRASPVSHELLGQTKTQVHTYKERESPQDKKLRSVYEATAQAILDGVQFPELKGKDMPPIDASCLEYTENDGRACSVSGDLGVWYNPFDEPDPIWVRQVPLVDAYGEIVGYARYSEALPF